MQDTADKRKNTLDQRSKIIIAVCIVVSIVIIIGVVVAFLTQPGGDKEQFINGVYSMSVSDIGNSTYSFREDGTGVRTYVKGEELVTDEFEYSVSGSIPSRTITFTWVESGIKESHSYSDGEISGRDVILINDVVYYKQ